MEADPRFGLVKVNPLVAWTSAVRPGEEARAGRWRGRGKAECGLHARPADQVLAFNLQRP